MINAFQNWKVCECIGSGAFGKVYRIVRTEFGHTYEAALKVIEIPQHPSDIETIRHEGMSEKEVTEYFESVVEDIVKEITLMSKLKGNSYIVSYEDHDVVKKKDSFGWEIYIRMELLTPLYAYTEQYQMTMPDVIKMGIHLCNALELCERHHIIHRDIKPANIFVSNNGDFKLGDFGIARELEKTSCDLSKKGTKSYMAPEVYKGMEYNFSVDIYSLGIVLYRFLNNNRLPFYPNAPKSIRYSDKEEATILRMCGKEMPKPCNASSEIADIILKACAYIPSKRYGSAKEMREDLERVYQRECAMVDKGQRTEDTLAIEAKLKQKSIQEKDFKTAVEEQTAYISVNPNMENVNDEDRTVVIFPREDREELFSYNHAQEETVLLEHEGLEKAKNLLLQSQESVLEEKTTKRNGKVYFGISVGCLCIAFIFFGIWEISNSSQVGNMAGQTWVSQAVSGTFIIGNINLVPNTIETEWKEAKKALEAIGLHVEVKKEYHSFLKKGMVIQQSIEAGTDVDEGEWIVLVVSKGKKPKPTPKPTVRPTPVPTERPVWKPTQQTVPTPEEDSGTGNATEESSSWQPDDNDVDKSEAQKWDPDE